VTIAVTDVADTPPGKPDAPTFSDVQETQFRVVWAAPTAGSSAITGYGIQYKLSSEADDAYADVSPAPRGGGKRGFNVVTRQGQFIIPGTSYDVRVREQNAEGWGEWSDPGTVTTAGTAPAADTPPGKPDAPTFSDVQETQFRVVWAAPTAGSSAITGYGIQYKLSSETDDAYADVSPAPRGGGKRGFNVVTRQGQFIIPGTSYDVRVREQNAEGWGEWSDPGTVTTAGTAPAADTPPGKPDAPTFSDVQETQFRVVWAAPTAGSSAITGYGIQYKLSSEADDAFADVSPAPRGITRGFNVVARNGQDIAAGTSYDVRVRAKNSDGWGEWSDVGTVTTAGTAPPADS
jgi:Tfp pilus assembly protein PilZ